MDLILWRHAEAVAARDGENDLGRALTPKGERQARRMARWLHHALPASARVLSSPARRAQQTAGALDRSFRSVDALAPDGSVAGLLDAVRWHDSPVAVLVVGHQPTLGLVAAQLVGGLDPAATLPWRIKKGGVWWLRTRGNGDGGPPLTVLAVRSPDLL